MSDERLYMRLEMFVPEDVMSELSELLSKHGIESHMEMPFRRDASGYRPVFEASAYALKPQ